MMKATTNILPQLTNAGSTIPAEGSEQALLKLLGQGKFSEDEQSLMDFSNDETDFSKILSNGLEEKQTVTVGKPLEAKPELDLLAALGLSSNIEMGKESKNITSPEFNIVSNEESKLKPEVTLDSILGKSSQSLKDKLEVQAKIQSEPNTELSSDLKSNSKIEKITDRPFFLNPDIKVQKNNQASAALSKEKFPSAQNVMAADIIEMPTSQNVKVGQRLAINQFAKEQNMVGGNLFKLNRDVSEEEKNKVELKLDQSRSEWMDQVSQKSDSKITGSAISSSKSDVLDLSHIQANNRTELISKISNYIEQNAIRTENGIDLKVRHVDLGDIKIKVEKGAHGDVNLNMITDSVSTTKFLKANESELFSKLNQSGIKLGDFKIVTSSDSMQKLDQSTDFNMNKDSKGQNDQQRFSQGQNDQGREKRRELWERMSNQRAA